MVGDVHAFAASIDVDSTVAGSTIPISLSFGDILDEFDVTPISNRFLAWNDRWGIIFDLAYLKLETDVNVFVLEQFKELWMRRCASEDKAGKEQNRRHSSATVRFCDVASRCRNKQMRMYNYLSCSR